MSAVLRELPKRDANGRRVVSLRSAYTPRWYQHELHARAKRFNVWVCHRRFGKTVATIMETLQHIVRLRSQGVSDIRAGYVCPLKTQARKIAWPYIGKVTREAGFGDAVRLREQALEASFAFGATWSLYGVDKNPDAMRGEYFDIVALDEAAQISPRVWEEIIRPMLADREGRAIIIGTPAGRHNLFHRLYEYAATDEEWDRQFWTVDDTDAITDAELHAIRREYEGREERFAQEFMCDWDAALPGAYYARAMADAEREGRIGAYPYRADLPTVTTWDFGVLDPTIVLHLQQDGAYWNVVAADAQADMSLPELIGSIKLARGYTWVRHFAPHDASRRTYEAEGLPTRTTIAAQHGWTFDVVPSGPGAVTEGIEAVKQLLPRLRFNTTGERAVQWLVDALRAYRADEDGVGHVHKGRPVHDWASHWADALRCFAVAARSRAEAATPPIERQHVLDWNRGII